MKRKSRLSLDAYHLKLFAIVLMVIDHCYKMFMPNIIIALSNTLPMDIIFFVIYIGFGFTRMAFPIFAFFIAEGCYYTKNRTKYLQRLFLFGLLSEIPFQYLICTIMGSPLQLSFALSNVFFTLFLGAMAITGYDYCTKKQTLPVISLLPMFGCVALAFLLNTDYGGFGVLMIFVCYYYHSKSQKLLALSLVISAFSLGYIPITDSIVNGFHINYVIVFLSDWLFMMMSIFVLSKYNGTKGKSMKYFFYLFYPVHILLLLVLNYFMK